MLAHLDPDRGPADSPDASPTSVVPVRIAVRRASVEVPTDVVVHDPQATVASLAGALDLPADRLCLDGVPAAPDRTLAAAGFVRGSLVTVGERAPEPRRRGVALQAVAGLDAGATWWLDQREHALGRARTAELVVDAPGVARLHAIVDVGAGGRMTILDLVTGRRSRSDPLGLLRVAGTTLRAGPPPPSGSDPERTPTRACRTRWTTPLVRPPRLEPAPEPGKVVLSEALGPPTPGAEHGPGASLAVAPLVSSLVTGVVAAVLLGAPLLLLLGLAGAAAMAVPAGLGSWRRRRAGRRDEQARQLALVQAARDLSEDRCTRAARRWTSTRDLVSALATISDASPALWAVRAGDPAAFQATLGLGELREPPRLYRATGEPIDAADVPEALWAAAEAASTLVDVPVPLDLSPGQVVALVGDPGPVRAVARSLVVQLAAAHGPADLAVAVVEAAAPDDWAWVAWLPHATTSPRPDGDRDARHHLLVVDRPEVLVDAAHRVRRALAGAHPPAVLVLATELADLPACCTLVVEVTAQGGATLQAPAGGTLPTRVEVAGCSLARAASAARRLARFHDPEHDAPDGRLPDVVSLVELLGPVAVDADRMAAAWRTRQADAPTVARCAVTGDGPLELDLQRDGPHVLVGGTTGSGKSELLRALVLALAVSAPPHRLAFLLVDFKGGAAFDACAGLPHVAGLLTDLEGGEVERALTCLTAELTRRERCLRAAGADDLEAFTRARPAVPMPRLVVVVDEFAELAAQHPEALHALVAAARRGRALGVHLVLATQRPSGCVSDEIRANTNLRIALRTHDATDAVDVVGDRRPAAIDRHRPGRCVVRLGEGETVVAQAAHPDGGSALAGRPAVERLGDGPAVVGERMMARIVETVAAAAERLGVRPIPAVWPAPLPRELPWGDLAPGSFALADRPVEQRHDPVRWTRDSGHLVAMGATGSGTTSTLVAVALAAAAASSPDDLHLYAVDFGGGGLSRLADLPHTGAVVAAAEPERLARLVHWLDAELTERRHRPDGSRPRILLVVDGLAEWRATWTESRHGELLDRLDRLVTASPGRGIAVAFSAGRPGDLPTRIVGSCAVRLVGSLADPGEGAGIGVAAGAIRGLPPGRAVWVDEGVVVQVGRPPDDASIALVARWGRPHRPPAPIDTLPDVVGADLLPLHLGGPPWQVVLGLDSRHHGPVGLALHPGDGVLVAGPARSGRTSTLHLLASRLQATVPDLRTVLVHGRPSAPADLADVADVVVADATQVVEHLSDRTLVLVDDAERVDDPSGVLRELVVGHASGAVVAVAGRADLLRVGYGHWTQPLRRRGQGVLLRPGADDGEVFGLGLWRDAADLRGPGRGLLVVDGEARPVQLAQARRLPTADDR